MSEEDSNDLVSPILSCTLCSYYKTSEKKNVIGYCKRLNFYLYRNFAPICLAFTVEDQVRVIASLITSPPVGKKVTKIGVWEDANGNKKYVKFYEDEELLYTLTWSNAGEATEETYNITRTDE